MGNGRTGITVALRKGDFGAFRVIRRIGHDRFDTKQIGTGLTDDLLSHTLCGASPAEIGYQNFAAARSSGIIARAFRVLSPPGSLYSRCPGFTIFIGRTGSECRDGHGRHQAEQTSFHFHIIVIFNGSVSIPLQS